MPDLRTSSLPLVPLEGGVIVPQMVVQLGLESPEAQAAVAAAVASEGHVVLVPRVDGQFAAVGTVAAVEQTDRGSGGGVSAVLMRGLRRVRVGSGELHDGSALWVTTAPVDEPVRDAARARELAREYRAVLGEILSRRRAGRVADVLAGIDEPGALADTAVYSPDLSLQRKVEVLETLDVVDRLERVVEWARETLADLSLREQVRTDAAENMERSQREYLLRQQLAAIRSELGEGDDDVVADYRRRVAEAELPEAALAAVEREIDRLERMGEQNPEHGWVRSWLDTLLDVPWRTRSDDSLDLIAAREILDADHTGLDDVKDRLVEFLAVRKLRHDRGLDVQAASGRRGGGAILALAGPPGVGKTSLGESVARALGRRFVRVSLGGIRDEAEIRGHRRTYVGAQAGRIVRALREAGTMNPVVLLDEIDKVAADWRGDPTAALLEVLDPAQNHTFRDHYLEVDLDLSDVLFIGTANVIENIPGPLLDRLEVVRLDGYIDSEKVTIARDHLLPRLESRSGLDVNEVMVDDAALTSIVDGYTREAGVRGLERQLDKLLRKVATRIATREVAPPVTVGAADVRPLLGRPPVHREDIVRGVPGVATGLAVTGAGGDVLSVEATAMQGEAGLVVTGQLGDVMSESAQIAWSYVRSHAAALGIASVPQRLHLHVPAGAVPKDGPSAGITMVTALASLLTGRTVRSHLAMTGEVTLQGRVLPIGGVKQKLLAAHRAGLRVVVLPARNGDDLEDVPAAVLDELEVLLVDDVADVIGLALEPAAAVAA
jgi:ATP-dependent Lon protease